MQYKMEFKTAAMAILAATFLIREQKFFSYIFHDNKHIIATSDPFSKEIKELIKSDW